MKKFLKRTGYFFFLLISVFLLLEVCYRYQVIDFYSSEWKFLNKDISEKQKKTGKKILIFGDSYSVAPNSYIQVLLDSFPGCVFYNAAIPGTGIRQTALIASKRIAEVKPDFIIYQIYVGNDLTDIQHPTNWSALPFFRNCYWSLSDRLLFLHYLNYRMGQYASHGDLYAAKKDSLFSIDKYNSREKLFIQSDPFIYENAITLNGKYSALFDQLIEKIKLTFADYISSGKIYFVIIPHQLQVNEIYYNNMKKLRCSFKNSFSDLNTHYTFAEKFKTEFGNNIIDPLPFLQQNDSLADYFFANDPHLTDKGQQALGNFLVKQLEAQLKK